jgi:PASTA domain
MPLYPDTGEHERMQRSSRKSQRAPLGMFSAIVMIFIVILTFVLLLSGIYLASAMGIINVPWLTDAPVSAQPVPTQGVAVPDVVGLTYVQASQVAGASGFVLKVVSGPLKGSVTRQYPMPGTWAAKGSPLLVDLAAP